MGFLRNVMFTRKRSLVTLSSNGYTVEGIESMAISREKLEDYEIPLEFNTELLAGI